LAHRGIVEQIIVDTCHFKGNYPDSCSIEACVSETDDVVDANQWKMLLPQQKLSADHIHEYISEINDIGPVTHIRLNIFPDGGVSRLRILGKIKN
jgi:allantoicase